MFPAAAKAQGYVGAAADLGADCRYPACLPSKIANDAQPETGPFARSLCCKKWLERARGHLGRHPGPRIGNFDNDESVPLNPGLVLLWHAVCGSNVQSATAGHRVASIGRQVDDSKLKLGRIHIYQPQIGREVGFDCDPVAHTADQQFGHTAELDVDIDPGDHRRLRPREREKLPGQLFPALDGS